MSSHDDPSLVILFSLSMKNCGCCRAESSSEEACKCDPTSQMIDCSLSIRAKSEKSFWKTAGDRHPQSQITGMRNMQIRKVSFSDQGAKLDPSRVSQNIPFKLSLYLLIPRRGMANGRFGESRRVSNRNGWEARHFRWCLWSTASHSGARMNPVLAAVRARQPQSAILGAVPYVSP